MLCDRIVLLDRMVSINSLQVILSVLLSQKEFDLVSIRSIIQLLDTHQIDPATVKKLQRLGFVESAKFLNRHFDLNL